MRYHELDIPAESYEAILQENKTFEVVKNAANYESGDVVELLETDGKSRTGRRAEFMISYVSDHLQRDGNVVLSLKRIPFYGFDGRLVSS